jgi:HK97 family phage major capsid protein
MNKRTVIPNAKRFRQLSMDDLEIKSIDEEKRILWHPITREVEDRMGDIVRIDGGDMSEFEKKPGVLYGHDYRSMNPIPVIAENIGFEKDGDRLYAGTRFLAIETPGMSQGLRDLINDNWLLHAKKLLGWSIGFIPTKWDAMMENGSFMGYDFQEWKLLEYSSVIIPAHQDAVNDAFKGGTISGAVVKYFDQALDLSFENARPVDLAQARAIVEAGASDLPPALPVIPDEPEKRETAPVDIHPKEPAIAPEAKDKEQQATGGNMLEKILEKLGKGEELTQEEKDLLAKFRLAISPEKPADRPVRKLDLTDGLPGSQVRAITEIVNTPPKRLTEVERELQLFNDEAYIAATILGKNAHELKMWDRYFGRSSALKKAMDTATANEGAEWVPTLLSADFLERMRLEAKVASLFQDIPMPSSPFKKPYSAGLSASDFYFVGESTSDAPTASPPSTLATGDQTLTAKKLKARVLFSDELNEESIVPVIPHLRGELIRAGAEVVEDLILNGDTTATHQDADVVDSKDRRKAWSGLRKLCQSGNKADHSTFSTANFLVLLATMGKYGINPSDLAIIVGPTGYHKFRALAEVLTVDKYGAQATILNGEIGKLVGSPIIASDYIRQDLDATGVRAAAASTYTVYIIVNKRGFMLGTRGGVKLTFDTDAKVDQNQLIMSFRKAFQPIWTPSATITTIAIGYKVS